MEEQNNKRKVRFTSLEIREYPIQMGDSPASSRGVPITIGWEYYVAFQGVSIDAYEQHRPERRMQYQLKMESLQRIRILLEHSSAEYSPEEILRVIQQVDQLRMRRRRTVARLRFAPIEEVWEILCLQVLRATVRRSQYREYRTYLARWRDRDDNSNSDESIDAPKSRCRSSQGSRERNRITKLNTAFNKRPVIFDGTEPDDSNSCKSLDLREKLGRSKSSRTMLIDMTGSITSYCGAGLANAGDGTSCEDGDDSYIDSTAVALAQLSFE